MESTLRIEPKTWLAKFLLNDQLLLMVIIVNAVVIFLEESGISNGFILLVDNTCTFLFLLEMIIKHVCYGFKGYWASRWNRLDGILVILSLPQLVLVFFPEVGYDLSSLLVFRLFRVFRMFRLVRFFPDVTALVKNLRLALRQTSAIFVAFFIIILVFGLLNCALFKSVAPDYFSTPMQSIYSVFRMCTIEGWYEIPDTIAENSSELLGYVVKLYFCIFLLIGGIIGMSLINSIFVDAMVSDNNDDVKAQLKDMEAKIDRLLEENVKLKSEQHENQ